MKVYILYKEKYHREVVSVFTTHDDNPPPQNVIDRLEALDYTLIQYTPIQLNRDWEYPNVSSKEDAILEWENVVRDEVKGYMELDGLWSEEDWPEKF